MTDFRQQGKPPRLQWRYRSGLAPDSLSSPPCLLPAGGNLRLYSLQNHYRVRVCICQYGKRRPPDGPGKRRADSAVRRGVLRRYAGISRRNDAHYPLMRHRIPRFSREAKCLPALSIFIKKKDKKFVRANKYFLDHTKSLKNAGRRVKMETQPVRLRAGSARTYKERHKWKNYFT